MNRDSRRDVRRRARRLGRLGEGWAWLWLWAHGYPVVARNLRLGHLEVDLVARRRGVLHLVEVKTRLGRRSDPGAALTPAKRRRLVRAGEALLKWSRAGPAEVVSFDLIEVRVGRFWPRVVFVEDAFRADEVSRRPPS